MKNLSYIQRKEIIEELSEDLESKCGYEEYGIKRMRYFLLYENKENVSIGAYISGKGRRFYIPMYKEWAEKLSGVNKFRIYAKDNIGFMPVNDEKDIVQKKDLEDFYVAIMRTEEGSEVHFLELYHKNELVFSVKTANQWFKEGADLKLLYVIGENGKFTQRIFKEGKHIDLCESNDMWFLNAGYKAPKVEIKNGKHIEIVFNYTNCKRFFVAEYFAKTFGDEFLILPKQFEDDDTCNYLVRFSENRIDDISFMTYCVQAEIGGYAAYGFVIDELRKGCRRSKSPYDLWLENNIIWERIEHEKQCRDIVEHICKNIGEDKDIFNAPELKYFRKTNQGQLESLFEFLKQGCGKEDYFDYKAHKEKYNEIYESLVDSGIVQVKWKSEYELYKTVKRKYPDAIYQYRNRWLGMQSLDIYIPSLKIGIEYQGEQHYRPISLFGGEEQFEYRKILDETKKRLCKENGVRLIEWRYDENINTVLLGKKIKEVSEK